MLQKWKVGREFKRWDEEGEIPSNRHGRAIGKIDFTYWGGQGATNPNWRIGRNPSAQVNRKPKGKRVNLESDINH